MANLDAQANSHRDWYLALLAPASERKTKEPPASRDAEIASLDHASRKNRYSNYAKYQEFDVNLRISIIRDPDATIEILEIWLIKCFIAPPQSK